MVLCLQTAMAEDAHQPRVLPQVSKYSGEKIFHPRKYFRSPAHGNAYVLSFAFCFDKEDENYQFAMCQPFTYSRHKVAELCLFLIAVNELSLGERVEC